MNYYPIEEDINSTIAVAISSDFIYLPEGTITTPIVVSNICTIIGQNTTLDVRGLLEQHALFVTVNAEISSLTIINDDTIGYSGLCSQSCSPYILYVESTGYFGFKLESCNDATLENCKASNCNTGFEIINSMECSFEACEALICDLGFNLQGSSSIIGDSYGYQEFGLLIIPTDVSNLTAHTNFFFVVNAIEFKITTSSNIPTYNNIVQLINSCQSTDGTQLFSSNHNASIVNGDIRVTLLSEGSSVLIERGVTGLDLLYYLIDKNEVIQVICTEAGNFLGVNLSGKYWTFSTHTNDYVVWYQVSGTGSAPAVSGIPIEIDVIANDTSDAVASKTSAIITTVVSEITASVLGNIISIIINQKGDMTDATDVDTDFTINIEQGLIGSLETAVPGEDQASRTDRTHNNHFSRLSVHDCSIGLRIINANNNEFESSAVFNNTNIGIWQMPTSYSNRFRGEIYNNINYGVRNTDKTGSIHILDVASTWWGHITGPSGSGPGQGDKISNYTIFEPWLRSGTEPILPYPQTRDWIWRMLGDPIVRVELTEKHISDSIEIALERFMYYMSPEKTYHYIEIGPSTTEIILPVHVPKESVIEVTYSPHSQMFQQLTGAGEAFFLTYYLQQSGGTFASDFYIAMAYKETMERALGIKPTYEFVSHADETGNMRDFIRIYPRPNISLKIAILWSRPLTEEEVDAQFWIRKFGLAWAKEQLGRIRSKFASVPGPTGEAQLDGASLLSEAQQEKEALLQDLINRSEPLSFATG